MEGLSPMKFAVIGGDMRQIYLARQLKQDGHSVWVYASDPALTSEFPSDNMTFDMVECVVLPLPAVSGGELISAPLSDIRLEASDLFSWLQPGTTVVAGRVTPELHKLAERYSLRLFDYFEREEMAVLNAVPTVEGACAIAMEELPFTLHRAKTLVVGFGRIGKLLAHRLGALGSEVTVSARKYADLAWIEAYGYSSVRTGDLGSVVGNMDVIFNTVPAAVIDRDLLGKIPTDTLIIDLASKPGGGGDSGDKKVTEKALLFP